MARVNVTQSPTSTDVWQYFPFSSGVSGLVNTSLDPTGSPVYFELSSDTAGFTGQKSAIYLSLWQTTSGSGTTSAITVPEGATITLYGVVLTAKDDPGQLEWFSALASDDPSRALSADSLATLVNSHPDLRWRTTASVETVDLGGGLLTYYVVLTAKFAGDAYSFSPPPYPSPNRVTYTTSGPYTDWYLLYSPGTYSSRGQQLSPYSYTVFLEVWSLGNFSEFGSPTPAGEEDVLLATLSAPWPADNRVAFDVSRYLAPKTTVPFFATPLLVDQDVHLEQRATCGYYLRVGEQFTGGLDRSTMLPADASDSISNTYARKYYVSDSEVRWCCPGAYPLESVDPTSQPYWSQIIRVNNSNTYRPTRFMTRQPQGRLRRRPAELDVAYPEYLHFFVHIDRHSGPRMDVRVRTAFTFVDGSVSVQYSHNKSLAVSGFYWINANNASIGLDSAESASGLRVLTFDVSVEADRLGSGAYQTIVRPQTFDVDLNYEPNRYVKLWWRNSLGFFDQFEFEGTQSFTMSADPSSLSRSPDTGTGYHRDSLRRGYASRGTQGQYTARTGWVDAAHLGWLREIVDSTEVWVQTEFETHTGILYASRPKFLQAKVTGFEWSGSNDARLFDVTVTYEPSSPDNTLRQ